MIQWDVTDEHGNYLCKQAFVSFGCDEFISSDSDGKLYATGSRPEPYGTVKIKSVRTVGR